MLLLLLLFTVDAALDAPRLEKCVRGDRTAGDALLVTGRVVQPRPLRRGNVTVVQPPSALWRIANAKGRRGACWAAIKATAKSQASSIKLESNAVEAQSAWEAVNARPPGASVVVQVDGGNTAAHVVAGENCTEAAKRFAKVRGLPDEAIPSIVNALEGARRSEVYSVAQVAEAAEKSLLVNGSYACERASWKPDALAAYLKLSAVAVRARRTKVDARVVVGSLRALGLLQSSSLTAWALQRRRAYHTFQTLKKATLENDLAPSEREAARHAYERANVTGALRRRDRAEQHVALCEERLKEARKGSDAIAPAIAQHKAREEALLATLAQTRRENEEADRSVRSHLRDTVSGLCDATLKRPHLKCDNEDRKWLDEQLGLTQRDFLRFLNFKFASMASTHRFEALDAAVRVSTRLVSERRQFRDGVPATQVYSAAPSSRRSPSGTRRTSLEKTGRRP